jgi:hypothetical protein
MKKLVVFLALLMLAPFVGCTNDDDLTDTITNGTWRVSYYIEGGDDDTSLFSGYVFTFKSDGTVSVVRPSLPVAPGTWNEHDSDLRLDLDFGKSGLLERLNEDWFVDEVNDDEIFLHEPGAPFNQVEFHRI